MLDPTSIEAVVGLAQKFSEKGIHLTCVPDTPLALIVREAPVAVPEGADLSYSDVIPLLVEASRGEDHANYIAEIRKLGVEATRSVSDLTRNVVNPHILRVIDQYKKQMDVLRIIPQPYHVEAKYTPAVYKLPQGIEFAERWTRSLPISDPGNVNLGNYPANELLQLCMLSEEGGFNESMAELLQAQDGNGLRQLGEVISGRMTASQIHEDFVLALAILTENIKSPGSGVPTSVEQYNSSRLAVGNIAGRRALQVIQALESNLKNCVLYYRVTQSAPGVIDVCGEVYNNLLNDKFTVEALYGNELGNRRYRGQQLNDPENVRKLTDVYLEDRAKRQHAHNLNTAVLSRTAVQDVLREDQRARAAAGEFTVEGDTAEKSWGRLRDFIDKIFASRQATAEPAMVIAAAVCFVWYAHTDAWRFVDIMLAIEKSQPELKPEEVASLAILQYIGEWTCCMVSQTANVQ